MPGFAHKLQAINRFCVVALLYQYGNEFGLRRMSWVGIGYGCEYAESPSAIKKNLINLMLLHKIT